MTPEAAPSHPAEVQNLPDQLSRLYFRLVLPLVSFCALWATYLDPPHNYVAVLPFALTLLFSAPLLGRLSTKWQWHVQLGLTVLHVVMVWLVALFSPLLGWHGGQASISILLIVTPLTVLSWTFLFYERAQLGRMLSVLLSVAASLLIERWLSMSGQNVSLALLLLVACIIATQFGWNVTELQRRALRGEQAARRDQLTGLPNRRAFDEALHLEWPAGLLVVLDIDHFKLVNDTYGHDAGDRVLRAVADVLKDTLPDQARAYRWGGEEFVVLLPEFKTAEGVQVLEEVRHEMATRTFVRGTHVTLSAGISIYGETTLQDAFQQADTALMTAKRGGRNRVVMHGAENGSTQAAESTVEVSSSVPRAAV